MLVYQRVNPLESAEVFRKFCPKDQASEAFEWALILVGVVLVRAIQEQLGWMGTDSHWKNSMSHQNGHEDPRTYPPVNYHNYEKSPCLLGKSLINGIFSIAFCMFTRPHCWTLTFGVDGRACSLQLAFGSRRPPALQRSSAFFWSFHFWSTYFMIQNPKNEYFTC